MVAKIGFDTMENGPSKGWVTYTLPLAPLAVGQLNSYVRQVAPRHFTTRAVVLVLRLLT